MGFELFLTYGALAFVIEHQHTGRHGLLMDVEAATAGVQYLHVNTPLSPGEGR